MKPSKYNYFIPDGEKVIFCNGITEHFFYVSERNYPRFRDVVENPDNFTESIPDFIERLRRTGFVIDNNTDEMEALMAKRRAEMRPDQYYLMILPTYQCNLRCWYCTQDHSSVWLSDKTMESLRHHVDYVLTNNKEIRTFLLSWFGGEPLLAYQKVRDFTVYVHRKCEEAGIGFSCHITTNATLLDPVRIQDLKDAGVTSYQITVDGDKSTHDGIKVLPSESAYEKTLANIEQIARHTGVILRFNYTSDNLKPEAIISNLSSRLSEEARKRLTFHIIKVWQEEDISVDDGRVEDLFSRADEAGLNPALGTMGMCYADHKYYNCIFPNGRVGKCDNHGINSVPALLDEDGKIEWPDDLAYVSQSHLEEGGVCRDCEYLPMCWGPCPSARKQMLSNGGKVKCRYADKSKCTEFIRNFCKNGKASEQRIISC